MNTAKLKAALKRFGIRVKTKGDKHYLVDPPVRGAYFTLQDGPTLHYFDSLMGSVAVSGRPTPVKDDPRAVAKVIKDRLTQWNTAILANPRGASVFYRTANQGAVYHFTSFKGALGILKTDTINPTENFQASHTERGLVPGVSLTRNPGLQLYGPVRLTLSSDVVRHRHKMQPFEFEPGRRGKRPSEGGLPQKWQNAEEYVQGPLKGVKKALLRIDVVAGRSYRKRDGAGYVEKFERMVGVPVKVWETKRLPPASRITAAALRHQMAQRVTLAARDPFLGLTPELAESLRAFLVDLAFWMGNNNPFHLKRVCKTVSKDKELRTWLKMHATRSSYPDLFYGKRAVSPQPAVGDSWTRKEKCQQWSLHRKVATWFAGGPGGILVQASASPARVLIDIDQVSAVGGRFPRGLREIMSPGDNGSSAAEMFSGEAYEGEVITRPLPGTVAEVF